MMSRGPEYESNITPDVFHRETKPTTRDSVGKSGVDKVGPGVKTAEMVHKFSEHAR